MIEKKIVKGQIGKTLVYSFNITDSQEVMTWETFKFYTPGDTTGIDIPAGEISLARDQELDKEVILCVEAGEMISYEIFEGADRPALDLDSNSDVLVWVIIPSDSNQEIKITYKNVIDEQVQQ